MPVAFALLALQSLAMTGHSLLALLHPHPNKS